MVVIIYLIMIVMMIIFRLGFRSLSIMLSHQSILFLIFLQITTHAGMKVFIINISSFIEFCMAYFFKKLTFLSFA